MLLQHGDTDAAVALLRMGRRAREVVPACVGLSLALLADDLTFTLVASDEEAAGLDAVQYVDGGPCLSAGNGDEPVEARSEDLLDEDRWLLFARASAAAGVASTLSLPIVRNGRTMGTVNLYAATPDAFTGRHQQLARALGASGEGAVTNADLGFTTRTRADETPKRLEEQADIDIAIGIIASSKGVDIPVAEGQLADAARRAGISEAQAARVFRYLGSW
jgi:GAF domain-containing protein